MEIRIQIIHKMTSIEQVTKNYLKFIESLLSEPAKYPSHHLDVEEKVIRFLAVNHVEGDVALMMTVARNDIKIKLNHMSGSIFYIKDNDTYHISIYIGESLIESGAVISYFYVRGNKGISFWNGINFKNLKNQIQLEINIIKNVKYRKVVFKEIEQSCSKEVFKNFHLFSDGKIICSNGEVKVSRILLSMRTNFFLVYFTKYTTDSSIKLNFPKIFFEIYIEYLILQTLPEDTLVNISELIEFGNYIGDIEFVKYLYHHVWDKIEDSEKKILNDLMEMYHLTSNQRL
jgi:hypothetical protein